MGDRNTAVLDTLQRKALTMRGESLRKPLAEDGMRRVIGGAIERALHLAGLTKQEVSYAMGYGENQSPISRWIAGTETPQFAKLFAVARLKPALLVALAELDQDNVEIRTQIIVRRRIG